MLLKENIAIEDVRIVIFGFSNFYVLTLSLYTHRRINTKNKLHLIKN